MNRIYADDEKEMESIMAWFDRRITIAEHLKDPHLFIIYLSSFKRMWRESFDTMDNVPEAYKAKIRSQFAKLKELNSDNPTRSSTQTGEPIGM